MTEEEFIQNIDCRFPYSNEAAWTALVKSGASISPNAAFMVLHEVCRPPRNNRPTRKHLKRIAKFWASQFQHHLATRIFEVAMKRINGQSISTEEALFHFSEIRKVKYQYNALAIVYFTCENMQRSVEDRHDEIVKEWESA